MRLQVKAHFPAPRRFRAIQELPFVSILIFALRLTVRTTFLVLYVYKATTRSFANAAA